MGRRSHYKAIRAGPYDPSVDKIAIRKMMAESSHRAHDREPFVREKEDFASLEKHISQHRGRPVLAVPGRSIYVFVPDECSEGQHPMG